MTPEKQFKEKKGKRSPQKFAYLLQLTRTPISMTMNYNEPWREPSFLSKIILNFQVVFLLFAVCCLFLSFSFILIWLHSSFRFFFSFSLELRERWIRWYLQPTQIIENIYDGKLR
jgi:hypothetical protein